MALAAWAPGLRGPLGAAPAQLHMVVMATHAGDTPIMGASPAVAAAVPRGEGVTPRTLATHGGANGMALQDMGEHEPVGCKKVGRPGMKESDSARNSRGRRTGPEHGRSVSRHAETRRVSPSRWNRLSRPPRGSQPQATQRPQEPPPPHPRARVSHTHREHPRPRHHGTRHTATMRPRHKVQQNRVGK